MLNTEYTFHLVLRTTAGTLPSNLVRVRTPTMTDTSGVCVCFGTVGDAVVLEIAEMALREMKAKWSDKVQVDTTHFVHDAVGNTGRRAGRARGGVPRRSAAQHPRCAAALDLCLPH